MKQLRINEVTDINNDLLMIEVGDDQSYPIFVLAFNEKTGGMSIKIPLKSRIAEFEIEEFQKLVERLKVHLKDWAVKVADKN